MVEAHGRKEDIRTPSTTHNTRQKSFMAVRLACFASLATLHKAVHTSLRRQCQARDHSERLALVKGEGVLAHNMSQRRLHLQHGKAIANAHAGAAAKRHKRVGARHLCRCNRCCRKRHPKSTNASSVPRESDRDRTSQARARTRGLGGDCRS